MITALRSHLAANPHLSPSVLFGARRSLLSLLMTSVLLLAVACQAPTDSADEPTEAASGEASSAAFELQEMSLQDLQLAMEDGTYTAKRITELYLERIADLNPQLHAVIEVNPEALDIAAALDEERSEKGARGPLHGIPILLKDNIATADETETTAGSLALVGARPLEDSAVAASLRQAGAVLLGKANLSEWANFRSTNSSSGWSGRGRQTNNPYALDRNPCGSSSGSGAAASANFAAAAIGTETNGSIVCPSSANGLVGIKPTVGLVSRKGIIPIAEAYDTAGPMARTVHDATLILGALVGVDAGDGATAASEGKFHRDYTQFLDAEGLKGTRIGVARTFFGFDPRVDQLMEEAIEVMRQQGAEIIDPVEVPSFQDFEGSSYQVMLYEFKHGLEQWLADLGDQTELKTLDDLIAWNVAHADASMPYFGQEIIEAAAEKGGLDAAEYLEALEKSRRIARQEGIDKAMDEHRLDAIIGPTGGPAWTTDLVNGDHFGGSSSTPAATAGYPNITVPAGYIQGLPVGISFFGRAWSEPTLLPIAYGYEQATRHRRAPNLQASLPQP